MKLNKRRQVMSTNINANVLLLFSNKNPYYDQSNLNFISLIRTFLVFMLIYNHLNIIQSLRNKGLKLFKKNYDK